MNYIKECNMFFDQLELNQLSSSSVSLWFILLQYHNKSGWKDEFSVPASALKLKAGLSEGSFQRARKELMEKGLLTYKSMGRNLAAVYQMISREAQFSQSMEEQKTREVDEGANLKAEPVSQQTVNMEEQAEEVSVEQVMEQLEGKVEPLFKQKESKKEKTKPLHDLDACRFYETNFGDLTPFVGDKIMGWCSELSEELVIEAMKIALQQNKRFFQYCEGILKRWQGLGIKGIEDTELNVRPNLPKPKEDVFDVFEEIRMERGL
ncbi:DnaD domain protein [Halobacillus rhizosphaerae]|uniref:DnaD domain-containing protein n=1 Tax=Halobacillus rhizosphaerae TaxID=3064889 RepID=UPI00398AC3BC